MVPNMSFFIIACACRYVTQRDVQVLVPFPNQKKTKKFIYIRTPFYKEVAAANAAIRCVRAPYSIYVLFNKFADACAKVTFPCIQDIISKHSYRRSVANFAINNGDPLLTETLVMYNPSADDGVEPMVRHRR
jgi:hypothetical protein